MKIARIAGALALALVAAPPALAQKECTKSEAAAAEKAAERVVNYRNLRDAWKDYRHCDTGQVEEVFTDAILRLLVAWKDVDTIASDMQAQPEYKQFIHKHLKSPMAKEDRPSIHSRAKNTCPPIQDEFCKELIEVVKDPAQAPAAAPKALGK